MTRERRTHGFSVVDRLGSLQAPYLSGCRKVAALRQLMIGIDRGEALYTDHACHWSIMPRVALSRISVSGRSFPFN